MATDTMVAQSI